MSELDRLRADLKLIEAVAMQYKADVFIDDIRDDLREKIARLEAESDPWREAKKDLAYIVKALDWKSVGYYVDHLAAENDRLAKRAAELEAEIKAEDDSDIADAEKVLGRIVGFDKGKPGGDKTAIVIERMLRPHDRITMQRRIKMQRRELRRLNKKMYDQAFERHRLKCRIAELEDGLAAIDPDGYQLGDFRVMKTAQEIAGRCERGRR